MAPHAFHARVQDSLIQEEGLRRETGEKDYIVAIYVRRGSDDKFQVRQSQHWTNLDFLFAETPKTHCCYAYYAGFSCKEVVRPTPSTVSILHDSSRNCGFYCWWTGWKRTSLEIFWWRWSKRKIATTKTLRKELEDRPVSYLQWEVSLI